jgi:hypothetical protein
MKKTLLFCTAVLICMGASAYDFVVDGIYYNKLANNRVEVTYLSSGNPNNCYKGEVTIPASVTSDGVTYTVGRIGDRAFANCAVTAVEIPSSVTYIGSYAFRQCGDLKTVTGGESVNTVGENAFIKVPWVDAQPEGLLYIGHVAYCYVTKTTTSSIKTLDVADGTTDISAGAMALCPQLTTLHLPASLTHVGERAFYFCNKLTDIWCDAQNPAELEKEVFAQTSNAAYGVKARVKSYGGVNTQTCVLHVPHGCIESYKAASGWADFDNIREDAETRNVTNVTAPTGGVQKVEYFTTDGRRAAANAKGVIISKSTYAGGETVTKKGIRK